MNRTGSVSQLPERRPRRTHASRTAFEPIPCLIVGLASPWMGRHRTRWRRACRATSLAEDCWLPPAAVES